MKLFGLMIVCILVLLAWEDAFALTIPTGSVISSDGEVVDSCSTSSAKKNMNNDGYHVFAKCLCIQVEKNIVKIDLNDLRGKNKNEVKEIITDAIYEEISDKMVDDVVNEITDKVNDDVKDIVEKVEKDVEKITEKVEKVVEEASKELSRDEIEKIIAKTIYGGEQHQGYVQRTWDRNGFENIVDGTYNGGWEAKSNAADAIAEARKG